MNINEICDYFKECDFHELNEDNFIYNIIDPLSSSTLDFTYSNGASKGVIIFNSTKYVIKIPFCGYTLDEDHQTIFRPFTGARDNQDGDDYCLAESIIYEKAKKFNKNIAKFFAPTKYYPNPYDFPLYIQPKCKIYNETGSFSSSADIEKIKKYSVSCFPSSSIGWLADAFIQYGAEDFDSFLSFVNKYNIGDLSLDNLGYLNKKPVCIDYSDYME